MSTPSTETRARGRQQQAQQHGDGGGLAGAVAAQQPGYGAGGDLYTQAVHREHAVEALGQVLGPDRWVRHLESLGQAESAGDSARASQYNCRPWVQL